MKIHPTKLENLSLSICQETDGKLILKSVDLFYSGGQTRMYFAAANALEKTLSHGFKEALMSCFDPDREVKPVYSFPEFEYHGFGVSVFKLRIVRTGGHDARRFVVRLKYVIGDLQQLFGVPITIGLPDSHQRERVCTEILGDIALPLLNLLSNSDDAEGDLRLSHGYTGLQGRSDELKFYISLLTRYMSEPANFAPASQVARLA